MKAYEFKKYENGCYWNFEDCEDNVVIKAESAEEAEEILMGMVDADFEEEAANYAAYEIEDATEYAESHHCTFWN